MNAIKVYGIPNCDTTQKMLKYLQENAFDFEFKDFKKDTISIAKLREWAKKVGWKQLLNKRSTTWRSLSPEIQASVQDDESAIFLMKEYPSLIKRPLVEFKSQIMLGFDVQQIKRLDGSK